MLWKYNPCWTLVFYVGIESFIFLECWSIYVNYYPPFHSCVITQIIKVVACQMLIREDILRIFLEYGQNLECFIMNSHLGCPFYPLVSCPLHPIWMRWGRYTKTFFFIKLWLMKIFSLLLFQVFGPRAHWSYCGTIPSRRKKEGRCHLQCRVLPTIFSMAFQSI